MTPKATEGNRRRMARWRAKNRKRWRGARVLEPRAYIESGMDPANPKLLILGNR